MFFFFFFFFLNCFCFRAAATPPHTHPEREVLSFKDGYGGAFHTLGGGCQKCRSIH